MLAVNTQRKFKICARGRQIPHDVTYGWSLKRDTVNRLTDAENRLAAAGGGEGRTGRLGLADAD